MNTTTANSTTDHKDEWDFSFSPIFIISTYSLNVLLGLPLNLYIIVLLLPGRCAVDPSDIFSLNQAVVEIFIAFLGPFHSLCKVSLKLCLFETVGFFLATSMCSRCLFQCCVCLERYLAVVHPVTFLRYKSARYRAACSITAWMCSVVNGIIAIVSYPNMPFSAFAVMYLLVLLVDVFCCASILKRLRHPGPRDTESDAGEMNSAKKKAFQIVSVNLLIFLIQNIPISFAFCFQKTTSEYAFSTAVNISLAVNILTGFYQPVYLLHRTGKLSVCVSTCRIRSASATSTEHVVVL